MIRPLLTLVSLLLVASLSAQGIFLPHRRKAFQAAAKAAFSDNFNRADSDSMGSNWTEIASDVDIVSNEANAPNTFFDFRHRAIAYTGTACNTVEQYVKVDLTGAALQRPGIIFRYTDSSSAHYELQFDDNNDRIYWYRFASPGGSKAQIGSSVVYTFSFPITVGLTITGTGNSTTIRVWVSPPTNTPTSASDWGGDTTPDFTITDDPSTAVDTGNYVGLGGDDSSGGALSYDNFYGGDL